MGRKKKQKLSAREWSSPIEIQLRNALVTQVMNVASHSVHIDDFSTSHLPAIGAVHEKRLMLVKDHEDWLINDQFSSYGDEGNARWDWNLYGAVSILTYKVDLLLEDCANGAYMAIECDGHEWHDRTKQQASADRARDRELLRVGVPVVRFTGSDIHHDADRCAVEVIETLKAIGEQSFLNGHHRGFSDGHDVGKMRGREEAAVWEANRGIFRGILSEVG